MATKRAIGGQYETKAIHYLESIGYILIIKNYFTPRGEIDLVLSRADKLYFVEVKYRASTTYGSPREAITPKKISHMKQAALYYIKKECSIYTPFVISFMGIKREGEQLHFDFIENIFS
ncbi:MAG TPA: YraN family protein [Fusibacter sp.]|nr:YraN family protein [Fusibacter sp.]